MDYITIVNTIRDQSSALYQERVPVLTKDNLDEVGSPILEYQAVKNEFLGGLVGVISFTRASNRRFKNPLAVLKKGGKPFGTDIQEIYVNPIQAETFDGSNTSDMLNVKKPDVKTIYHRMNRQDKYPVSVSDAQLKTAFTSGSAMTSFIESIFIAMYAGDEMDEYLLMRNLVASGIADNKIPSVALTYTGDEKTSKDLVKLIKTYSGNFAFPEKQYNGYNKLNAEAIAAGTVTACTTWCPRENQVFLIRTDVDANTDVEVLAKAFNMDKTDFLARKIVVDSFGDDDTLCYIGDENAFQVYDDLYTVRSFDNGSNLTTNYWLHHWQTISLSLYANGVAIKKAAD